MSTSDAKVTIRIYSQNISTFEKRFIWVAEISREYAPLFFFFFFFLKLPNGKQSKFTHFHH